MYRPTMRRAKVEQLLRTIDQKPTQCSSRHLCKNRSPSPPAKAGLGQGSPPPRLSPENLIHAKTSQTKLFAPQKLPAPLGGGLVRSVCSCANPKNELPLLTVEVNRPETPTSRACPPPPQKINTQVGTHKDPLHTRRSRSSKRRTQMGPKGQQAGLLTALPEFNNGRLREQIS